MGMKWREGNVVFNCWRIVIRKKVNGTKKGERPEQGDDALWGKVFNGRMTSIGTKGNRGRKVMK
jgi:hypothetical protein